jgi:asparagine synthase (glutamine-hydrolysing)
MCGIAGFMRPQGNLPDNQSIVNSMLSSIAHRGPDDSGTFQAGPVSLGHRRLSILDLTSAGRQPLCNEDRTIWISFNGEIYNFKALAARLTDLGHRFASHTDTEVIVHAYEEWGLDCLEKLQGMFAFALWDAPRRRLWLVRDRLGIKPLFYATLPGAGVAFASEAKALLELPEVGRDLDYEALSYFLASNWTPAPHTLFARIRQLEPGEYLLVEPGREPTITRYWDLIFDESVHKSEKLWLEEFEALMQEVVADHLQADVPFGAFLSGGLDSSSLVRWMSDILKHPVRTFSIGYREKSYDETAHAQCVAQSCGTEHRRFELTAEDAMILPQVVRHAEEPTADSSMISLWRLSQEARKDVTMVLSGDGADEILAGYPTYQARLGVNLFRTLPGFCRRALAKGAGLLPVSDKKMTLGFKLRRFMHGAGHPPDDAHALWRVIFNREARQDLLAPVAAMPGADADMLDVYREYFKRTNARHPLNRMLYVDTRLYLPGDMLVKVDRMTMAHGLEARVPFLDHRVAEFCATLPPALKLKAWRIKKYLLRKTMEGRLPSAVITRRKAGFNLPKAPWIKGELREFTRDHLSPVRLSSMGLFDLKTVDHILKDHFQGKADNSHQIWGLLTLSLWWEVFKS